MSNFPISSTAQLNQLSKNLLQKIKFPEKGKSAIKSHNTLLAAIAESIPDSDYNIHSLKAELDSTPNNPLAMADDYFNKLVKSEIVNFITLITKSELYGLLAGTIMRVDQGAEEILKEETFSINYLQAPYVYKSETDKNVTRAIIGHELWLPHSEEQQNSPLYSKEYDLVTEQLAVKTFLNDILACFMTNIADSCETENIIIPGFEEHLINETAVDKLIKQELKAFQYADYY